MSAKAQKAELGIAGWAGVLWQPCEVIGETPKKYRIRAYERIRLGGRCRWLNVGETALVPKHAVKFMAKEHTPNPYDLSEATHNCAGKLITKPRKP